MVTYSNNLSPELVQYQEGPVPGRASTRKGIVLALVCLAAFSALLQALANSSGFLFQALLYHKTAVEVSYCVSACASRGVYRDFLPNGRPDLRRHCWYCRGSFDLHAGCMSVWKSLCVVLDHDLDHDDEHMVSLHEQGNPIHSIHLVTSVRWAFRIPSNNP